MIDLTKSAIDRRIVTQQQLARSIEKQQLMETPLSISSSVRQKLAYPEDASETSSMKVVKYHIGDSPSVRQKVDAKSVRDAMRCTKIVL